MTEIFLHMKCTKGRNPQSTCGWTKSRLMSHPWTWQILTSSTILADIHRWCSLTPHHLSEQMLISVGDPTLWWWTRVQLRSRSSLVGIHILADAYRNMSAVYSNPKGAKIDLYSRQILENWRMEHSVMEVWFRWFSVANGCFFRFKM